MKRGMTFEYLMCRADLNFEVDFGVNGATGTIVTQWDLIVSFSSIITIFFKYVAFPFKFNFLNLEVLSGVVLPAGPRPPKRPSGQPKPYFGWPYWQGWQK